MTHGERDRLSQFINPFPKHLQIRDVLLRRFGREFAPGERLPTEHALAREYSVSRETVRAALRWLEEEDLIRRQPGKGTFLVKLPMRFRQRRLTGLVEDVTNLGLDTEAEVLETGISFPPVDVAAALHVATDEPMFRILRLRYLDNKPLAQHDALLPVNIGEQAVKLDLRRTTLFHEIGKTLGYPIYEDCQFVDAASADAELAARLG